MNKLQTKLLATMICTLVSTNSVAAGANLVKDIDIHATKPYPVLVVKSDGVQYTGVENGLVSFNARVSGVCKDIAHVVWASYALLDTPTYTSMNNTLAENILDVSGKKHKTFGTNKFVSVQWQPNLKIKQKALDVCSTYMTQSLQQNKKVAEILKERHRITLDSGLYGNFGLRCDNSLTVGVDRQSVMQPMEVLCDSSIAPAPTPVVALGGNGTIQQPLHITAAKIAVTPSTSTGICPRQILANAELTFNQTPGTPRNYQVRFLEDGKVVSDWKKLSLLNDSTVKLQHLINVSATEKANQPDAKKTQEPKAPLAVKPKSSVTVEVKADGNSTKTALALYQAGCTTPSTATMVPANKDNQPDMTSRQGIKIGNKSSSWDGQISLEQSDFTASTARGCFARFSYDVVNIGTADAAGFNSRLRLSGKQAHLQNNIDLNKNQSKNVSGNILLPAGSYPITASIDDGKTIAESKENNNIYKITVTVPESCGGDMMARPTPIPTGAVPTSVPRPTSAAPTSAPRPTSAAPTSKSRPTGT